MDLTAYCLALATRLINNLLGILHDVEHEQEGHFIVINTSNKYNYKV